MTRELFQLASPPPKPMTLHYRCLARGCDWIRETFAKDETALARQECPKILTLARQGDWIRETFAKDETALARQECPKILNLAGKKTQCRGDSYPVKIEGKCPGCRYRQYVVEEYYFDDELGDLARCQRCNIRYIILPK